MSPGGIRHRHAHPVIACLLAVLLALQGLAAGVAAASGPAHTHRTSVDRTMVLEDVRRPTTELGVRPTHLAAWLGHAHPGGVPQRHHHAGAMLDLLPAAGDPLNLLGDLDGALGAALAGLVAILADETAACGCSLEDVRATHAPWALHTHPSDPLERPPRAA